MRVQQADGSVKDEAVVVGSKVEKKQLITNLSIRDTTLHNVTTDPINIVSWDTLNFSGDKSLYVNNSLNQAVTLLIYHGYSDVSGQRNTITVNIPASSGMFLGKSDQTKLGEPTAFLAVGASCSIAPTSGSLNVYVMAKSGG